MREEWIVNNQKVICNDCVEEMRTMAEESVDVVITSPPYNLGIKYNTYDDNLDPNSYHTWIYVVAKNILRVLKEKGTFFLNVGNSCKNPSFAMDVCQIVKNAGFVLQNNIVWVKSITVNDTSSGHFKPIKSSRFLNDQHESIFHFTKTGNVSIDRLAVGVPYADKSNIERWKHEGKSGKPDCRCRGNTWFIPYGTVQKKKDHPAGFPVGLPLNCIKLAGVKDDLIVLDPFVGSGTTLLACNQLHVCGIGIELDPSYCQMTIENIRNIHENSLQK